MLAITDRPQGMGSLHEPSRQLQLLLEELSNLLILQLASLGGRVGNMRGVTWVGVGGWG